jgi:methylmalonyl-CoA mutase C-terminal domain/subunit
MEKKTKVLVAKLGLDSHWRGVMAVCRALRDAGMEVIFVGNQFPEAIVSTALQEDVDVIGLSSLSGNHLILAPEVVKLLRNERGEDILVVLGGTIPRGDIAKLKKVGIAEIFGPGTPLDDITNYIKSEVTKFRLSKKS